MNFRGTILRGGNGRLHYVDDMLICRVFEKLGHSVSTAASLSRRFRQVWRQAACLALSRSSCQFHGRSSSSLGEDARQFGQNVGQPSLWIESFHFCRDNDAVHGGSALSAAVPTPRHDAECWDVDPGLLSIPSACGADRMVVADQTHDGSRHRPCDLRMAPRSLFPHG